MPGMASAHPFAGREATVFGEQRANPRAESGRERLGIAQGRKSHDAAERLAEQISGHQIGLTRTHIDGDDRAAPRIDVEKRGLAAADGLARGPFDDEATLEQIADEETDAAAAHSHGAGEVGARDRLVGADEIQHDLAVDLARGALGGDLKANRVDLSHLVFDLD